MAKVKLTKGRLFKIPDDDRFFMFLKSRGSRYVDAMALEYSEEKGRLVFVGVEKKIKRAGLYLPALPESEEEFRELYKL